jgi:hypothetical protein
MPDQGDVTQILELQHVHDVLNVSVEIDLWPAKVSALAKAGQRRCVNLVAGLPQARRHLLPAPATEPGTRHEYERGHRLPLAILPSST